SQELFLSLRLHFSFADIGIIPFLIMFRGWMLVVKSARLIQVIPCANKAKRYSGDDHISLEFNLFLKLNFIFTMFISQNGFHRISSYWINQNPSQFFNVYLKKLSHPGVVALIYYF